MFFPHLVVNPVIIKKIMDNEKKKKDEKIMKKIIKKVLTKKITNVIISM